MAWIPTAFLLVLGPVLGSLNRGRGRWPLALGGLAGAAALPLVGPGDVQLLQLVLAAWSVIYAVKTWECHRGRIWDPAMWAPDQPARFLLWWFVPPDTSIPRTPDEATANRRTGLRRIVRGGGKLAGYVALLAINRYWDGLHDHWPVHNLWGLWMLYALLTGAADILTGLAMQTGIYARETFDRPFISASPREFWSRRWNLFIARFATRHVYFPLDGIHHPVRATLLVFAASGLMHEFLVYAVARGPVERTGWMMAFFSINAGVVIAQTALDRGRRGRSRFRLPRPIAIALHVGYLVVGMCLFLPPLDEAVAFSSWWR